MSWMLVGDADVWEEAALGPAPKSWEDLEQLALSTSERFKFSLRSLAAGLHELKALQRLGPSCKPVSHVLGALRLCEVDDASEPTTNAHDASANGESAGSTKTSLQASLDGSSEYPVDSCDLRSSGDALSSTRPADQTNGSAKHDNHSAEAHTEGCNASGSVNSSRRELLGNSRRPKCSTATHLMLVQALGTPLYGSELTDPALAWQIYSSLREIHKTLVHGDVNRANIVWDPSGYYFQFVDLELATWREEGARVVSEAMAFPPVSSVAHGSTPVTRVIVHGTLEFCSINQLKGKWPTCADDLISLYWSTVCAFCPRSLWWGGLMLRALEYDERNEIESRLLLTEEANLLAYAQVLYLSSDQESVTLYRSHDLQQPGDQQPVRFEESLEAPFVPAEASALVRWKHYVARAFAQKHVLRLTLSAGTEDEAAAMSDMYRELAEFLHKMGDFDFESSWEQLRAEFPMDADFLVALQECERKSEAPLPYSQYLDQLETMGQEEASLPHAIDEDEHPTVSFHGVNELQTSEHHTIWGARERRKHGNSVLVHTPWEFNFSRSYEDCAKALRACCQSASMGFEPVDNPWDCAVVALQEARLREHEKVKKSWQTWRSRWWALPLVAALSLSVLRIWQGAYKRVRKQG